MPQNDASPRLEVERERINIKERRKKKRRENKRRKEKTEKKKRKEIKYNVHICYTGGHKV